MSRSPLWVKTPLIRSAHMSARLGCDVYLKLEHLQPSHSFKTRGISHFIQRTVAEHGKGVHLIIASGGNAGIAAAHAAQQMGVRCSVFIPEGVSPSPSTLNLLRQHGADVVIVGKIYRDALSAAQNAVKREDNAIMVPAYDHPTVWEGHASMVEEIAGQLGKPPGAIICSVGGAGLIGGIIQGCKNAGWDNVPIVAAETHGSNCFYRSISVNPGKWANAHDLPEGDVIVHNAEHDIDIVHLAQLKSLATSLGATSPAAGVVKMALSRPGPVRCVSMPDEVAMQAALHFADEHKTLTELACSVTLAIGRPDVFGSLSLKADVVVFIVCGGFITSLEEMRKYTDILKEHAHGNSSLIVSVDGKDLTIAL